MIRWILLFMICICSVFSTDPPVLHKGRYRPMSAYSKLWLTEIYGSPSIKRMHKELLNSQTIHPEDIIWDLTLHNDQKWNSFPLFYIDNKEILSILKGSAKPGYYSYNELRSIKGLPSLDRKLYLYQNAEFRSIPPPYHGTSWKPITSLAQENNPSCYPENEFQTLQASFFRLQSALMQNDDREIKKRKEELKVSLYDSFRHIEGTLSIQGSQNALHYPTYSQLFAEAVYYQYPWLDGTLACFVVMLFFYLIGYRKTSVLFYVLGFCLNTFILVLRCWILGRPPVANMFETMLYVPWVTEVVGLVFCFFSKNGRLFLFGSGVVAIILLLLARISLVDHDLENIPAVLNSQYWLLIHVLMVVGSYGIFLLSGILAHIFLVQSWFTLPRIDPRWILYSMYLGTGLLITGTILGGVWAAQSWGRFWDWDPKESWAFISSCVYLIVIHSFYFRKIGTFGLVIGSIVGLQAITFTWYGVNYILGTGLHSYGFGSGGEGFYYLFICLELAFILIHTAFKQNLHLLQAKSVH